PLRTSWDKSTSQVKTPARATGGRISRPALLAASMWEPAQRVYPDSTRASSSLSRVPHNYPVPRRKTTQPAPAVTPEEANRNWYGMRTAQMCEIWKTIWGADAARVSCVLGAQSVSTDSATQSLICPRWVGPGNGPCFKHHLDAVAIAPYFGFSVPAAWTLQ